MSSWRCPLVYEHEAHVSSVGTASASPLIPVLLCDSIELGHNIKGIRDFKMSTGTIMKKALVDSNIDLIQCKLDVGDFQWALAPRALVEEFKGRFAPRSSLDAVRLSGLLVERKSVSDLYHSKEDNRYVNQKLKMKAVLAELAGKDVPKALFYVVEQNADVIFAHTPWGNGPELLPEEVRRLAIAARLECTAQSIGVIHTRCVSNPYNGNLFGTAQELIAMHCAASKMLLRTLHSVQMWPTFERIHKVQATAMQAVPSQAPARKRPRSPEGGGAAGGHEVIVIDDSTDEDKFEMPPLAAHAPAQTPAPLLIRAPNHEHTAFVGAHAAILAYLAKPGKAPTSLRYETSDMVRGSFGEGGGACLLVGAHRVVFVSGKDYIKCIQRFVLHDRRSGVGAGGASSAAVGPLNALRDAVLAAARPFAAVARAPRIVLLVEDMSVALQSATDKLKSIKNGGGKKLNTEEAALMSVPLTEHILGNLHAHLRLDQIDFVQSYGPDVSFGPTGFGGSARIILGLADAQMSAKKTVGH